MQAEEDTVAVRDYSSVTTRDIVVGMLTENTGRALCDSGDAYGRNWQRNQGRDFDAEPKVKVRWSTWRQSGADFGRLELEATVSLYHWMMENLEFCPELQTQLETFASRADQEDNGWFQVVDEFTDHLKSEGRLSGRAECENTYNNPDHWDLSQVLQFTYLTVEVEPDDLPEEVLIVSVHGGCDVRGGYTAPKCFRLRGEFYEVYDSAHVGNVYSEDGDGWYFDGYVGERQKPEVGDRNDSNIENPLSVPAFDVEWFEDHPQFGSGVSLLRRSDEEMLNLLTATTVKDPDNVLALHKANRDTYEEGLVFEIAKHLSGDYAEFVIVDTQHRAHLFEAERGSITYTTRLFAGNNIF